MSPDDTPAASPRQDEMSVPAPSLAATFWRKVRKTDGCWVWVGSKLPSGYGTFGPRKLKRYAHRFSCELHFGPVPEGLQVLHNCPGGDNPSCVNPAHLWLGTQADNVRDMWAKGRGKTPESAGELNGRAKLSRLQAQEIRTRYRSGGVSCGRLAREFGVHKSLIALIVKGRVWKP